MTSENSEDKISQKVLPLEEKTYEGDLMLEDY